MRVAHERDGEIRPRVRHFGQEMPSLVESSKLAERSDQDGVTRPLEIRLAERAVMQLVSVDSATPDGLDHVVLADDAVAIAQEIDQKIEDLRLHGDKLRAAPQFVRVDIKRIAAELEWHDRLGAGRSRGIIRAISGANQVIRKVLPASAAHPRVT
jgi:hypothetical protein